MVADFKERDIELEVNHVNSDEEAMKLLSKGSFDAYLMDYRLSQGGSYLDAPSFAAYVRTETAKKKGISRQTPIFMITNEKGLHILKRENKNRQDLFDMALLKGDYRNNKDLIISSMVAYINAYREIDSCKFSIEKVLQLSKTEVKEYIDSRLLKELNQMKADKDIYHYLKLIEQYLLGSPCVLVNTQIFAARLGVDMESSGEAFEVVLDKMKSCKYSGVLSEVKERWWYPRVMSKWKEITSEQSLRMAEAKERVKLLNNYYNTTLKPADPIDKCKSTCYWTICEALKRPLDPAEGYVCNYRYKMPWEENEYISLFGALEYPDFQKLLSESDKREILAYGKER